MAAADKVIITCAIAGAINTPTMSPYLPITPDQIVTEAIVLGAGARQLRIAAQAAAMGSNNRVGLEDSLWAGKGRLAKSNAEQVQLARKIVEGLGKGVATPDEARAILSLKGADKVAF